MVAPSEQTLVIDKFTGLNESNHPSKLGDGDLAVLENMYVGKDGSLKKRPGLELINSTADLMVRFLDNYEYGLNAYTAVFIASGGAGLYTLDDDGSVTLRDAVATNIRWGFPYGDKFYYGAASGIKMMAAFAITSATSAGGSVPVNSHDGIFHKQRMFVVVYDANDRPFRIQYSSPNNFSGDPGGVVSWPTTNTIDILYRGQGGYITALASYNDILYIFKNDSIWALYVQGTSATDWVLKLVHPNIGCILPRNILIADNIMYFVGIQGLETNVYRFDGSTPQIISNDLNFNDVFKYDRAPLRSSKAFVQWHDFLVLINEFQLGASPGAYASHLLVYDFRLQTWARWIFPAALPVLSIEGILSAPSTYKLKSLFVCLRENSGFTASSIYRFSEVSDIAGLLYQDNGNNYTAKFRTKEFLISPFDDYERIKEGSLDYIGASAITPTYIADGTTTALAAGASGGTRSSLRFAAPGRSRRIQWEMSDSGGNNSWQAMSLAMRYAKAAQQSLSKAP